MPAVGIRILLVDDHAVVREGYRTLLAKQGGFSVVGEACDAAAAYQAYKDLRPDVVIMDISMPGRGGIDAIEHLRRRDPQVRVLVFTMHSSVAYATQAFRAGAKGYVTKSSEPSILIEATRAVARGETVLCPEISGALARTQLKGDKSRLEDLSPREFEILRMLILAQSTDKIAENLNISRKTVANYHYYIKSKLGVSSDVELMYFGMQCGLLTPMFPSE